MKRIITAVDGPAGSGKSSVSKEVAVKTGLMYIDSGAIYRAITWQMCRKFDTLSPEIPFKEHLGDLNIEQTFHSDGTSSTFVKGKDVSQEIRSEMITKNIGVVSDNVDVRSFVTGLLRKWAGEKSIIMDGRDIGTVVFPDADLKIYLDASVDIRAERRIKEYQEMGKNVDEKGIKKQIILRDKQDKERPLGALRKADDAVVIDTSHMTIDEVIGEMAERINQLRS